MKDRDEIIREVKAINADVEMARHKLNATAIRLAEAVLKNRDTIGDIRNLISKEIRDFIEAEEQYTKSRDEAAAACERLIKCLYCDLYGDVI